MKSSLALTVALFTACTTTTLRESPNAVKPSAFAEDVTFLKKYGKVVELTDKSGQSKVAVMPALQGRVMTSTAGDPQNASFGWINRALFASRDTSVHINAFGGEERFWLGPEGGQYSIFFEKGKPFNLDNWKTPRLIDLDNYELVSSSENKAAFSKSARLKNYSGTTFDLKISREIEVLEPTDAFQFLGVTRPQGVSAVAYQTRNVVLNTGKTAWTKSTGLLSIWLLGMFNPSPEMVIVVPFRDGTGPVVNDDYFGKVPSARLKVGKGVIFFKGDGAHRSKIGLTPARAKDVLGSYDIAASTLTIVKYNKPDDSVQDYVNSKWEIQDQPYAGDVINSYNDGPPSPGAKPLGPFYERETSSPAKELQPNESITHIQTTFHIQGEKEGLNQIATAVLGVSLDEIAAAFD